MEADVIVGGINFCLAVSEDTDGTYFPRSGLLEDIRNITRKSSQVLAIFQKKLSDKEVYQKICYVAKGLELANLNLPLEISGQVCVPKNK